MAATTDRQRMEAQEWKDYTTTKKIMTNIFSAYDATFDMKPMPTYCYVDARMKAEKGGKSKSYTIEIKERNINGELETLPLKCKKYCNIMAETKENETPLAIYLVNDSEYYIFNLQKLDMNKVIIKNWNIPKVNFAKITEKMEYEETPTFFIPINQSIYNGIIPHNANN